MNLIRNIAIDVVISLNILFGIMTIHSSDVIAQDQEQQPKPGIVIIVTFENGTTKAIYSNSTNIQALNGGYFIPDPSVSAAKPLPTIYDLDSFGIRKIYPDGTFGMKAELVKDRQDGSSNRWNVASDEPPGAIPDPKTNIHYEVTTYLKVTQPFDGFNLKIWGPHHGSSGIPFDNVKNQAGDLSPCCWYDIGIDSNGDIKPQIEYPVPDNKDVPLPPGSINNTSSIMNKWIGVKWIIFKDASGQRHVEFWHDKAVDAAGKPGNDWQRLFHKVDTGDWLNKNYSPPDQQEIELRVRNVDPAAIEVKYAYARDIKPPAVSRG
jgi:hypothetical protein